MQIQQIFISLFLLISIYVNGTQCSDVNLFSQNDVDNFNGCDSIMGNLYISGFDIVSVSNLSSVKYIDGDAIIESNPMLNSLNGLEMIEVTGDISISQNEMLQFISNFNDLINARSIRIFENDILEEISGFDLLLSTEDLIIENNQELRTLDGFASLDQISNEFLVLTNDLLEEIVGFSSLNAVTTKLEIVSNPSLIEISGFNAFSDVGQISISDNGLLIDISGLSSLNNVFSDLEIFDNTSLSACCGIYDLLDQANVGGTVSIQNNAPGCNSETEILTICAPQSNPCDSSILLSSQQEVDNFPGCDTIHGSLEISGADITNLAALDSIIYIDGDLLIHDNPSLKALENFGQLTATNGQIDVYRNDSLLYITDFQNITSAKHVKVRSNKLVEGIKLMPNLTAVNNVIIAGNKSLKYFAGFPNLVHSNGQIRIHNNKALLQVDAFHSLVTVKNHLRITKNSVLVSFDDFTKLTDIGMTLEISNNDNLQDFSNLYMLQTAQNVIIDKNTSLDNLKGLYSLKKCDNLTISNNPSLKSLDGLDSLQAVGSDLTIEDNAILNYCCAIYPLLDQAQVGGVTTIQNNDNDCDSEAIVLQVCSPSPCAQAPQNLDSWNWGNWKVFEWDTAFGAERCVVFGKADNQNNWRYLGRSWAQDPSWAITSRNRFRRVFRNSNYVTWRVRCRCQDPNGGWNWSPWSVNDTIYNNGSYKTLPQGNEDIISQLNYEEPNLYPNPSEGLFNYRISPLIDQETIEVKVFDLSGRVVFQDNNVTVGDGQLDLRFLSNGIYNVSMEYLDGASDIKKVIITK